MQAQDVHRRVDQALAARVRLADDRPVLRADGEEELGGESEEPGERSEGVDLPAHQHAWV